MNRFPPAENGPRRELQSIGRTLDDLGAASEAPLLVRDLWTPLLWSSAGLLTILAFVVWLIIGQPVSR
jgi:hypothetical protein